ncbi:PARD6B [Bugula neritina]|uniref:PARD6B n=1 Tax=Bugula neritina TaxID=10212 RepID=A0A7J7IV19_BUGNE|nr:PARD6B [Bugula neritina]
MKESDGLFLIESRIMAKYAKHTNGVGSLIEVKSKFDAEFRRFSVDINGVTTSDEFYELVNKLHKLKDIPFLITYTDTYGDQLPINNDDNFMKALTTVKGVLRLQIQRKGQNEKTPPRKPHLAISFPEDFRRVSAIIDVDIVPETHRRVRLMKNGSEKPLGFYIRDGVSVRVTPHGLEKVPGIFISRLVQGG